MVGLNTIGLMSLKEEETQGMCMHREAMLVHSKKETLFKPRKEASVDTKSTNILSLDFQPLKWWGNTFLLLKPHRLWYYGSPSRLTQEMNLSYRIGKHDPSTLYFYVPLPYFTLGIISFTFILKCTMALQIDDNMSNYEYTLISLILLFLFSQNIELFIKIL